MISNERGVCTKCDEVAILVNKRHALCNSCNQQRLNAQKDPTQVEAKHKKRLQALKRTSLKTIKPLRARTRIKASSKKQSQTNNALSVVYSQLNIPKRCSGCHTNTTLTHSHLIRRSLRKDLELDADNITYHCLHFNCHTKWESNDIRIMSELLDFQSNLEYIQRKDVDLWNRLIYQMDYPGEYVLICRETLNTIKRVSSTNLKADLLNNDIKYHFKITAIYE